MNDNPEARKAIWSASEPIPASATTMTTLRRWADSNALVTGDIVTKGRLRVRAPFLVKPRRAESATGVVFEVQRGHVG
jgi:hypothetical protein